MKFSKRYKFSDWPNHDIPDVAAGVYAIWHADKLIYCGMSGREIEKAIQNGRKRYGLFNRLKSHRVGRLSGDQFCVYVGNRIIIPSLKPELFPKFASGEINLDKLTGEYIRSHFEYQFLLVSSSQEAFTLEMEARRGKTFGQKPYLNPAV